MHLHRNGLLFPRAELDGGVVVCVIITVSTPGFHQCISSVAVYCLLAQIRCSALDVSSLRDDLQVTRGGGVA
jgi:hypothetical protein